MLLLRRLQRRHCLLQLCRAPRLLLLLQQRREERRGKNGSQWGESTPGADDVATRTGNCKQTALQRQHGVPCTDHLLAQLRDVCLQPSVLLGSCL